MGLFSNLTRLARNSGAIRDKATRIANQHGDKIAGGIDKAAGAADDRTGGKHRDRIDKGAGKAKEALRKLAGDEDGPPRDPDERPEPEPPAAGGPDRPPNPPPNPPPTPGG